VKFFAFFCLDASIVSFSIAIDFMAIFGFGATYGGTKDVSKDFVKRGVACVGWSPNQSPTLHTMLKHIKTGDVVYLKAQPANAGLIIKAV
jgi:hypothetical protein